MAEQSTDNQNNRKNLREIIKDGETPIYYINWFTIGYSPTEVHIILNEHGKTKCIIQLPFSAAKSAILGLTQILKSYEERTNSQVKSLEEIQNILGQKK